MEKEPTDLNIELANKFAIPAMMASNAYLNFDSRTYFPIESLGWAKVDMRGESVSKDKNSYAPMTWFGRIFSNLQFDIWEHKDGKQTIFAFKGTDEKIDWPAGNLAVGISIPYKSAKKQVKKYLRINPERTVTLTGHSLGGGLALSVSVWEGLDAVVFNTSPRIFDGRKNMNKPAARKAIFQEKEILQLIRKNYPKFQEKMRSEDIIRTAFDYGGENRHRADLLAEGILRCAKSIPALKALAERLEVKVRCCF